MYAGVVGWVRVQCKTGVVVSRCFVFGGRCR